MAIFFMVSACSYDGENSRRDYAKDGSPQQKGGTDNFALGDDSIVNESDFYSLSACERWSVCVGSGVLAASICAASCSNPATSLACKKCVTGLAGTVAAGEVTAGITQGKSILVQCLQAAQQCGDDISGEVEEGGLATPEVIDGDSVACASIKLNKKKFGYENKLSCHRCCKSSVDRLNPDICPATRDPQRTTCDRAYRSCALECGQYYSGQKKIPNGIVRPLP